MKASSPTSVKELKSLYGLINYCARFIPNAAILISPFRELTKKNARWQWNTKHDEALTAIKKALTTEAMAYFNKDWATVITTELLLAILVLVMHLLQLTLIQGIQLSILVLKLLPLLLVMLEQMLQQQG
jgi:hypothetical protein